MASARPIAALRFSAKIDTSVNSATTRSTAIAPENCQSPTATGKPRPSATEDPDQHEEAERHREGLHDEHVPARLRGDLRAEIIACNPPARTVTPSRSCMISSARSAACNRASFSRRRDTRDDQSCLTVLADQRIRARARSTPTSPWRCAGTPPTASRCRCPPLGRAALDAAVGPDGDDHPHVALTELARQQFSGL